MKNLLFPIGLVATLAGCSKKEEPAPAPNPYLGHWQSESEVGR
ncbi:lipoprotein [Hymenobacter sp. RP-2-7]|uniref:Lipoprotein n=1 Tax=Hymenobacter polaris TaxID=2682546 RepID=A0A7Y0ABL3_9BACT|nr:membrane lipoprotein lipid attachment site-containing protein [Hymenobacter polaris]NML64293.1 lipoprotein [Hymenobacter polaris]